jgi:HYDIN/CFA65/VesB-like, Ig-like domain
LHLLSQYKGKNLCPILFVSLITVVVMVGCGGNSSSTPVSPTPATPDAAHIAFSPAPLDFGTVPVGVQKTGSVTVSNKNGSTATISQILVQGAGFSIVSAPPMPLVLPAGQSSTVTVAFNPPSAGPASGSVSVVLNGTTSSTTEALAGTGLASGQLAVSPSAMDFGTVALGSSQTQTGSLTAGSSGITVSSASWNGAGYSLSGVTFPLTVPAGQSVPFTVTFAPQTAGSSLGSISFLSNASNSPGTETLSGSGLQPAHSVALAWNASPSTVVGYNIYRGGQTGGPYTRLNASVQPSLTYSDNGVQAGVTYFYVVTAVDANSVESPFSIESAALIPTP